MDIIMRMSMKNTERWIIVSPAHLVPLMTSQLFQTLRTMCFHRATFHWNQISLVFCRYIYIRMQIMFLFKHIIVLRVLARTKRDKITINQTLSPRRTESDVITHNGRHEISIRRAIVGYLLIRIWDVIHFAANLVTIKYRLSTPLPHYPDVQDKSSEKRLTGASESMG